VKRTDAVLVAALLVFASLAAAQQAVPATNPAYLGLDLNNYPGDANLKTLHQTFSYTGYWLNPAPGETRNTWTGHRAAVDSAGFGFLVLFNGRLYAQLKTVANATRLGRSDAAAAAATARREGFPRATIIFLDQEQGGRMLPEQKAYIYAWVDGVTAAGFRAGIYCSGMAAADDGNVVTAQDIREHDIREHAAGRDITYWVTNDACPPAPGCAFPQRPPHPAESGIAFAEVWQFAQSPQRKDVAGRCTNYSGDGSCHAPGIAAPEGLAVDVNSATSADPSHARTR
jgi:hypothetical protein